MNTQTAEQFATYLDSIFISEEISSVKAGQIAAMLRSLAAENERLRAEVAANAKLFLDDIKTSETEIERLRIALRKIRDEPSNTLSDGKALKEIIKIARAALERK